MPRRFPAPWSVHELERAFVVADATGQAVAYTYFRKDENEARQAKVLTHDEARRIAANIAKLPELLSRTPESAPASISDRGSTICSQIPMQ